MKKIIYLIAIATLCSVVSCKKKTCSGTCQNGGSCVDGNCECPGGWSGENCEISTDPCYNVVCYHGGTCSNGICSCPPHYSGADCSMQEAPARMYLSRISLAGFSPADRNGNLWDAGSTADIYPVIKLGSTVLFDGSLMRKDDASYATDYFFYPNDTVFLDDLTNPNYVYELWDYDGGGGADQLMIGFNFTPYSSTGGYPGSATLTDTTFYESKFELRMNYGYYW